MKRLLRLLVIILLPQLLFAQLFPNLGGQRAGTSAAQFLKIGVGARAIGMGESFIAVANDAEALYWNPAGLVLMEKSSVIFSHNSWLVDTQLQFVGLAYKIDNQNSVGVSITYLYTDDMEETTELQPFGTGRKFSYGDFLGSLTYARFLTNQFSVGLTAKYMQETIYTLTMRSLLFDLGIHYDVGWNSTRFAMVITNFGQDMKPDGSLESNTLDNELVKTNSFQSFPPPITLRIGIAGEVYTSENHKVTTSIQLNHPNDNKENVNFGVEYWMQNMIAFRAGIKTAQAEESYSVGMGLHFPISFTDLRMDYALTDFGRLGFVNRFALQFQF